MICLRHACSAICAKPFIASEKFESQMNHDADNKSLEYDVSMRRGGETRLHEKKSESEHGAHDGRFKAQARNVHVHIFSRVRFFFLIMLARLSRSIYKNIMLPAIYDQ